MAAQSNPDLKARDLRGYVAETQRANGGRTETMGRSGFAGTVEGSGARGPKAGGGAYGARIALDGDAKPAKPKTSNTERVRR